MISPSTYGYIFDNLIPRTGHLSPVISVKLATVHALFPYDSTKCFATSVSIPYICINGKCNVGLHPSAPINFNSLVLHFPAFIPKYFTVASMVSSAIWRYVVHFPPAIVTRPEVGVILVRCERTRDSVFLACGSRTRGRIPDQAAKTSPRRTWMSRGSTYLLSWRRIQSMSFSVGMG